MTVKKTIIRWPDKFYDTFSKTIETASVYDQVYSIQS